VRFLREYVFANAGLKIVALCISLTLWTTYTSEPPAEAGFRVPIEFTSIPSQLEIAGDVPTLVNVRVRGRSALLRRMTSADLDLQLDFKNAKEGTLDLQITPQMVHALYGATVVQVSPHELHVTLVQSHGSPHPPG
jgi:hypothetical protein